MKTILIKKTLLFLLVITGVHTIQGQSIKVPDTIYANNSKTVSLFFPKPVRQGIGGRSNYIFTYNKEKQQYFGVLQATPGEESNLLAITTDGQIYSYILKYSKKLPKLSYFIRITESIGNEIREQKVTSDIAGNDKCHKQTETVVQKDPAIKTPLKTDKTKDSLNEFYAKNCASFLKNSRRNLHRIKQKYKIRLSIKDVAYHKGALYYLIEIENRSMIDYEINYLRFFTENKQGWSKRSSQALQVKSLYKYHFPKTIKAHSKREFVMVLPKFTVDKKKNVFIELNEKDGERDLRLKGI